MLKPNAWADEVAAHATAHYMKRTVVVVSGQQIIMIQPDSADSRDKHPIIVGHDQNHFSFVHTQQIQQILKQHMHKSPRAFADYRASVMDDENCSYVTRSTVRSIKLRRNCTRTNASKSTSRTIHQIVYPTRHVPGDTICPNARGSDEASEQDVSWDDGDDEEEYDKLPSSKAASNPLLKFDARDLIQCGTIFGYLGMIGLCHFLGGSDLQLQPALRISRPGHEPSGPLPDVVSRQAPFVKESWQSEVELLERGAMQPVPTMPDDNLSQDIVFATQRQICTAGMFSNCLIHSWRKIGNIIFKLSIGLGLCLLICAQGFVMDEQFSNSGNCTSCAQTTQQLSANLLSSQAMSLSEQIRRVAGQGNLALPRAWRERGGVRPLVVPNLSLERPRAKARIEPPLPSRSPDLDMIQQVWDDEQLPNADAHDHDEEVEVIEIEEDNSGLETQQLAPEEQQQITLISLGAKWYDNRQVDHQGVVVLCDLRSVYNPDRNWRLCSHVGYHPETVRTLIKNDGFVNKVKSAICQALQHERSTIKFMCNAGRHRSVAATHVAYGVLKDLIGTNCIRIEHASSHHWRGLCNLGCNDCWDFYHHPPAGYLQVISEIREGVLQSLRAYMERPVPCFRMPGNAHGFFCRTDKSSNAHAGSQLVDCELEKALECAVEGDSCCDTYEVCSFDTDKLQEFNENSQAIQDAQQLKFVAGCFVVQPFQQHNFHKKQLQQIVRNRNFQQANFDLTEFLFGRAIASCLRRVAVFTWFTSLQHAQLCLYERLSLGGSGLPIAKWCNDYNCDSPVLHFKLLQPRKRVDSDACSWASHAHGWISLVCVLGHLRVVDSVSHQITCNESGSPLSLKVRKTMKSPFQPGNASTWWGDKGRKAYCGVAWDYMNNRDRILEECGMAWDPFYDKIRVAVPLLGGFTCLGVTNYAPGSKCPVPNQRYDIWDAHCPREPRTGDDDLRNRHGKACRRTAWDSLGRLAGSPGLWGGALSRTCLLGCFCLAFVDISAVAVKSHLMQLGMQDVSLRTYAGQQANCSFGLNSSQATNCLSIGKFSNLKYGKFGNVQLEWKGTLEHNFGSIICDDNKREHFEASNDHLSDKHNHNFDQQTYSNFGNFPQLGERMALAEQIRRVAQSENYALPRAWRGRNRAAGNLVPYILERPAAKARLNPPMPSRSPDLDIVRAVVEEVEEMPTPPEPVEIVELLEDDPGIQEQQVHLVSVGIRWTNNQVVRDFGHLVECDLQNIDDPGRDRSLQAHLGYHPDTVSRLIGNMEFMQPFFDALFEALQHPQSTIRFTCASGRHRSVVAVHLAQAVLRGIVSNSNISVQHASRRRWGGLCNLQCAECYNFVYHPPAPYMRAVADIREDLLQALRGYMDRCRACMPTTQAVCCQTMPACLPYQTCQACAGPISNPSTSPSTCDMGKIKRFAVIFEAISSFLHNTTQQILVLQANKCAHAGGIAFIPSPFLNKDGTFTRSYVAMNAFLRSPCPFLVRSKACPLRKNVLDPASYWDELFKRFFIWSLFHTEGCQSVKGSTSPGQVPLGFSQHKLCSLALTNKYLCPLQPRREQIEVATPNQDGCGCGNCGILQGHNGGFSFLYILGRGSTLHWVELSLQQVCELCTHALQDAVHVFAYPDVHVSCQPVVLKVKSSVQCHNLNYLYIEGNTMRNCLGSCSSIFSNQLFADFTYQQIQFPCQFQDTTLCSEHCHRQIIRQQDFQQRGISFGILCLGLQLAMSTERLSEALRRVAKAKTPPSLPKAFVAFQGGPIAPKLIALRCPPKPPPERLARSSKDVSEEPPVAKPRLAPAEVTSKPSGRVWPPPTPPRAPRPSSSLTVPVEEISLQAESAHVPAVSPKPSAAPPMPPRAFNLEEDEAPNDGSCPVTPGADSSLAAASAPAPAVSPTPSAAPPTLPRVLNLEEDEALQGGNVGAIEITDDPDYNILLISEGLRFRDNRAFPFRGHEVWCDLRDVENPERDRRLQSHLGYHPLNIQNLMVNETFMRKLFNAMKEALEHRVSKIRFVCHSGRHRSVAATHLAQLILAGIVGEHRVAVRHASSGHWQNLCQLQCNQCWNFVHNPPVEFHRALAEIRRDLQQNCQAYMLRASHACQAVCLKLSWDVGYQHACVCTIAFSEQSCVAGDTSRDIEDPAFIAPCAGTGSNRQHQYDFLFVKNQQNEQIYHNMTTQSSNEGTNFQQLPRQVPDLNICSQEFRFFVSPAVFLGDRGIGIGCHADPSVFFDPFFSLVVRIALDVNVMNHLDACNPSPRMWDLPNCVPTGKEDHQARADTCTDVIQQRSCDDSCPANLCQQVSVQTPFTLYIGNLGLGRFSFEFFFQQFVGGYDNGAGAYSESSSYVRDEHFDPFTNEENLSNPIRDLPEDPIQAFDDDDPVCRDPIQDYDDDDNRGVYASSCQPTVLDDSGSEPVHPSSSDNQVHHRQLCNRKRSAQQAFEDDISRDIQHALQYEHVPSSQPHSAEKVSTNEVASLQQCLYDGYHFANSQQQATFSSREQEQQSCVGYNPCNTTFLGYLNEANLEFHNFGFPERSDIFDVWDVDSNGGFVLGLQPNQLLHHESNTGDSDTPIRSHNHVWEEWTIDSHGEFVFVGASRSVADTMPFDVLISQPNHAQQIEVLRAAEAFWAEWEQDIDGHMHQRPLSASQASRCRLNQSDSWHSMWDVDPYEFLSSEHYTSDVISEPSSHPSAQDPQMLQWAFQNQEPNVLRGGGKNSAQEEFQPTSKDVGKMVQKLKHVPHGLQNKQVRMLLVSNLTLMKKIERTTDAQHLLSCITAAAQRVGMQADKPQVALPSKGKSSSGKGKPNQSEQASSLAQSSFAATQPVQNIVDKGKGHGLPFSDKGKGKGPNLDKGQGKQNSTAKRQHNEVKGKGKGKDVPDSKPRDRPQTVMKLVPDGWSVFPQQEFQTNFGAVYMLDKPELIKQYAEKASGKSFPIGILAPKPYPIGVSEPQMLYIKVEKQIGDQTQIVSIQAFLHQLTYTPVEYRASAPCVELQKSEAGKTQVLYVTFTDEEASTQTKLDLRQHKNYAAKQWLSGIVLKRNPRADLEILDMWHLQTIDSKDADTTYQASIRVKQQHARRLLALSAPGALQVNCPATVRQQMDHVWLKDAGVPWEPSKVQEYLLKFKTDHLGAFCLRGTWAIRADKTKIDSFRQHLGKSEAPAYFLENLSPEWDYSDISELLRQLQWPAKLQEGDRRWRSGSCTWLVRAATPPPVNAFPVNFGHERRTVRIRAAKKPTQAKVATPTPEGPPIFHTWGAQMRNGAMRPSPARNPPTYADITKRKKEARPNDFGSESEEASDAEMEPEPSQKRPQLAAAVPAAPAADTLSQQLAEMREQFKEQHNHAAAENQALQQQLLSMQQQNAQQAQQISQLLAQIQELTAKLSNQQPASMQGGAGDSSGIPADL